MRVIRRPKFIVDFTGAYAWIAHDSERAAERLLDRIEATIDHLRQFPMIGELQAELAPDLRSIRVRPFKYLIFYRASENEILLIRLLHGAQSLEKQDYEP